MTINFGQGVTYTMSIKHITLSKPDMVLSFCSMHETSSHINLLKYYGWLNEIGSELHMHKNVGQTNKNVPCTLGTPGSQKYKETIKSYAI